MLSILYINNIVIMNIDKYSNMFWPVDNIVIFIIIH